MDLSEEEKVAIQSQVNDAIQTALTNQLLPAMKIAVNGRIDDFRKEMQPLIDAYGNWLSWKRMSITILTVLIAVGGFIQGIGDLWHLATTYFTIK
jgi:hypothetical protein